MKGIIKILFFAFGFLLPLHGGITVFFPDEFRWWKEFLLIFLFLGFFAFLVGNIVCSRNKTEKFCFSWKLCFSEIFAFLFLLYAFFRVLSDQDFYSSLMAFRYLGMGFFVFLLFSFGLKVFKKYDKDGQKIVLKFFYVFSTAFVLGNAFSVLFGIWAKFFGGFVFLQNFYSSTVSSWVPGQILPVYHQTSDGFIRLQGLASGPVEFGHLMLIAIFLLFLGFNSSEGASDLSTLKKITRLVMPTGRTSNHYTEDMEVRKSVFYGTIFWRCVLAILFIFGVLQSGSRAAMLGVGMILMFFAIKFFLPRIKHFCEKWQPDTILMGSKMLLVVIFLTVGVKFLASDFWYETDKKEQNYWNLWHISIERSGDAEHFSRPLEAVKMGFKHPIFGNLGHLGPAARAKNLSEKNDDSALVAENVFVDYFAQLGIFGLLFVLGFFASLFFSLNKKFILILVIFLGLMNLATIFDMTPVSLAFFAVLAFGKKTLWNEVSEKT